MKDAPRIGQACVVRGKECRIIAIRALGTVDVEALDGSGCWRVSGLSWTKAAA